MFFIHSLTCHLLHFACSPDCSELELAWNWSWNYNYHFYSCHSCWEVYILTIFFLMKHIHLCMWLIIFVFTGSISTNRVGSAAKIWDNCICGGHKTHLTCSCEDYTTYYCRHGCESCVYKQIPYGMVKQFAVAMTDLIPAQVFQHWQIKFLLTMELNHLSCQGK